MKKQRAGITLVALAITIIILLILAGVTISLTVGQRGILNRSQEAGRNYQEVAKKENEELENFLGETDNIIAGINTPSSGGSESGVEVTLANGNKITLTQTNVKDYLGKEVTNYKAGTEETENITIDSVDYTVSTRYRLYYIDFANKYGDGVGTVYLKADCVADIYNLPTTDEAVSTASNIKIRNLNPSLYKEGVTPPSKDNDNMKAVTWLTNETNWEGLKSGINEEVASNINYVVGAPSLEMMVDSYNTYYGLIGETPDTNTLDENSARVKLFYRYPDDTVIDGYEVGPSIDGTDESGYGYSTIDYAAKPNSAVNDMYCPRDDEYYWLASPSAARADRVMGVYPWNGGIVSSAYTNQWGRWCIYSVSFS